MKPLTTEQQVLAEEAADLAHRLASRWRRLHPKYADEIESSAAMGAMRAAESYDPAKGPESWEPWAALHIRYEILHELVKARERSSAAPAWPQEALEEVVDHRGSSGLAEAEKAAAGLLEALPAKHQLVCRLIYQEGLTASDAGRRIGLSAPSGRRLHDEAITFLRRRCPA